MAKAVELLEIISQDEQNRRIYEARQKELMDEAQRQYDSRKKGKAEGRAEEKINMAIKLLKVLSDEEIAEIAELPLAKVKELRAQK